LIKGPETVSVSNPSQGRDKGGEIKNTEDTKQKKQQNHWGGWGERGGVGQKKLRVDHRGPALSKKERRSVLLGLHGSDKAFLEKGKKKRCKLVRRKNQLLTEREKQYTLESKASSNIGRKGGQRAYIPCPEKASKEEQGCGSETTTSEERKACDKGGGREKQCN